MRTRKNHKELRKELSIVELKTLKMKYPNHVVFVRERWKNPNVFNVFDINDVLVMHSLGMKAYIQRDKFDECLQMLVKNGHSILVSDQI